MKRYNRLIVVGILAGLLAACSNTMTVPVGETATPIADTGTAAIQNEAADPPAITGDETADTTQIRPEGWSEDSHSNDVEPNYDTVFPQDAVNTITITIDPDQWAAMQADMTGILGEPGSGTGPGAGGPPPGEFIPAEGMEAPSGTPPEGEAPPGGFVRPRGDMAPGMGNVDLVSETPMWVPATVEFDGQTWNHVGIRYKGNSSLASTWNSGSIKLPFKLDFDQFEDDYPEIDNQRFFGFKELSFANGFGDDTFLRETLTYDLMQEAGLIAGETAFYEVILDYGEGPVSLGIYTAVEVVDDTVIEQALGDDSGNIYEADGAAASLAEGTADQIAGSFEKENNEDAADWSDIEALYTALHAETRETDPEQWRADLEAVFDVETFLNWLAVSTVAMNWDTYGAMSHNFYLYHDPETDQLVWVPWDHNLTFGSGGPGGPDAPGGGLPGGPGGRTDVSIDKADVTDQWPLIRFLLDDPEYHEVYLGFLAAVSDTFDAQVMTGHINQLAGLIRPVVAAAGKEATFDSGIDQLVTIVTERDAAVAEYLAAE